MAMYTWLQFFYLVNEEDDEPHDQIMRVTRRILRDVADPFSIPNNEFRELYGLTKDTTRVLIAELMPFMRNHE